MPAMTRQLDPSDFRAIRQVLDTDEFALGSDSSDPAPPDLISQSAWAGIMTLPVDVAIRTTNDFGSKIAELHMLESAWTEAFPEPSIVLSGMPDRFDSFQAATFILLHGFHKEAVSALRNCLETMTLATACTLANDSATWLGWLGGDEIRFKLLCDRLQTLPLLQAIEAQCRQVAGSGIYAGDNGCGRNAWASYRRGPSTAARHALPDRR
jgi:hypothetical protein